MEFKLFVAGCIFFVIAMIMLFMKKKGKVKSQKTFKVVYSWVDTIWTACLVASFIMFFFIQAFKIPSGSMISTLLIGDHLFVNKFIYGFHIPLTDGKRFARIRNIKRGDIVVFKAPPSGLSYEERQEGIEKDFIKRCVAIAGDKVEVKNKVLYINDIKQDEPYAIHGDNDIFGDVSNRIVDYQKTWETGHFAQIPVRDNFGPVIVPQGHYMMMGDNRDYSFDSRFFGPVADKYIKGRALFLYWPVKRWRLIK